MKRMRFPILILPVLAAFMPAPGPAAAQSGRFTPAIVVNDQVVTQYELEQRMRFLELLRIPGDVVEQAERGLIEDRLRRVAAKEAGIKVTDQQIAAGMAEFAGRANLETEQFLQIIQQAGIAPETFRDFVSAGLAWREVVRARFTPRISISEAEIDRAMSVVAQRGSGPRVLLSEIIIPVNPTTAPELQAIAADISQNIRSEAGFADAARRYSAAASRAEGGQIGWIPLTNLPPQARAAVAGLANGQISPPIPLGGAIGLFRLRGIQQGGAIEAGNLSLDYAQLLIPGGNSASALAEAERVRGEVDTCDDLYRVAANLPADRLSRETRPLSEIPAVIANELANLDDNESTTALTRGDALVFLMLCKRSATLASGASTSAAGEIAVDGAPAIDPELGFGKGPSRSQVREELTNQRLAGLADGYMAELRANALISRP